MNRPLKHEREILRRFAARLTARNRKCRVPALVLFTDDDRPVDWIEAASALPREAAIIIRSRDAKTREALAKSVLAVAKPRGIRLAIADDAKLAIRLRAAGLHIPEAAASQFATFRRLMPASFLTVSAHGERGLVKTSRMKADAAFLSPMFDTQSHPGASFLGSVRWARLNNGRNAPAFALGGINGRSVLKAIAAGASGIAVIGSWTTGP